VSAVLERTETYRTLIPRWTGHGDLTIKVNSRDTVYLRADQVEALAALTAWSTGEQLFDADWHLIEEQPYYTLDMAIARCELDGADAAAAFLSWLDEQLQTLLVDDVVDQGARVPSFIGSHPVAKAAEILDRDPQISIGQKRLFRHLEHLAWIQRGTAAEPWQPTQYALRNGWVTIRNVPLEVGRTTSMYPQVYVTPTGMTELRVALRALNAPTEPPTDHPTLFD
jgi:hypothetical protein